MVPTLDCVHMCLIISDTQPQTTNTPYHTKMSHYYQSIHHFSIPQMYLINPLTAHVFLYYERSLFLFQYVPVIHIVLIGKYVKVGLAKVLHNKTT